MSFLASLGRYEKMSIYLNYGTEARPKKQFYPSSSLRISELFGVPYRNMGDTKAATSPKYDPSMNSPENCTLRVAVQFTGSSAILLLHVIFGGVV